jgi:hypothetical protein
MGLVHSPIFTEEFWHALKHTLYQALALPKAAALVEGSQNSNMNRRWKERC